MKDMEDRPMFQTLQEGPDQTFVDEPNMLEVIHDKPAEQLKAEVAAFIGSQRYPFNRHYDQIPEVGNALLGGDHVTVRHDDGWEVQERTYSPGQYGDFLRNMDPETRNDVSFLTGKIRAYERFASNADRALHGATFDDEHYLGSGVQGVAARFEQEGRSLVAKQGGIDMNVIRAFRRGEGIAHIAQLEAVNIDRDVAIMDLIPGVGVGELPYAERPTGHEYVRDFIGTALAMHGAGLALDPNLDNLLYDETEGVGVIDYRVSFSPAIGPSSQVLPIVWEVWNCFASNEYRKAPEYGTDEHHIFMQGMLENQARFATAFYDVLEADYPDILQEAVTTRALDTVPGQFPDSELGRDLQERLFRLGLRGDLAA